VTAHQEVENNKIRKWIFVAGSSALTALVTVQIPDAAKALYPDAAIRAALTTLAIRDSVPVDEQLGLLPFKVNDLAGFRVGGGVPGRPVMFTGAPPRRLRRDGCVPAWGLTFSLPFPRARRCNPPTAMRSHATSSRRSPTCGIFASPRPSRCGSAASRATRSWPRPGTRRAPTR